VLQNGDGTVQILQIDSSSAPTLIQLPDGSTAQLAQVEAAPQIAASGVHTLAEVAAAAAEARTSEPQTEFIVADDGESEDSVLQAWATN